jgi:outer membrane murein-binding lipoprotein Lpp
VKALFLVVVVAALALPAAAAPPPKAQVAKLKRQVATLTAKVKRLQSENRSLKEALAGEPAAQRREARLIARIAEHDPCPMRRTNGSRPPSPDSASVQSSYGNGVLWVSLWPQGVFVNVPRGDGTLWVKLGWWHSDADAKVQIEGRRLDGPAPALRLESGDPISDGTRPSALPFPSEGCWEVTGRVGAASLTFVLLVLAA